VLANLLNATVIKNRWFVGPASTVHLIKECYKNVGGGHYIGAALRHNRNNDVSLNEKWMCYLHGPAVIRL